VSRSPNAGPRPWCRRRGTSNEGAFVPRSRSRGLGAGSLERPRPLTFQRGTRPKQRHRARSYDDLYDKVVARQGERARARRGLRRPRAWGHGASSRRGDQLNVAFSCWRGLASSVKARQRLYRRKMQGRASPLQRDVSPAVALNSRCYERFRSPRHGVVMVVLVVGEFPHGSDLERRRGFCCRRRRPVPRRESQDAFGCRLTSAWQDGA